MISKAIKYIAIYCVVLWAGHNPAQVSAGVHSIVGLGETLVNSVASAASSAVSSVGGGGH